MICKPLLRSFKYNIHYIFCSKPWTEWGSYCQEQHGCLGGNFRRRLIRNNSNDAFHEDVQMDNQGG